MKKPKLKLCPFCGGEAEISYYVDDFYKSYFSFCVKCMAKTQAYYGPDTDEDSGLASGISDAVKAWNKRYTPPKKKAKVDE